MPHPVDQHVGKRLRLRRSMLGVSQEHLGKKIGVTFQQVQKYERGTNRICASRLFNISKTLDVTPNFFFDELASTAGAEGFAEDSGASSFQSNALDDKEFLSLLRAYYKIKDKKVRKKVLDLVRTMSENEAA